MIQFPSRKFKEAIQKELFAIKTIFLKQKRGAELVTAVEKMAYLVLVGAEIDFGLTEILELAQSKKYKTRAAAWVALVFMGIQDDLAIQKVTDILQEQLLCYDKQWFQCLALTTISQIFSLDLYRAVGTKVADLAISPKSGDFVKKKAILVLGQIYKETKEQILLDKFGPGICAFLNSQSFAVRLAAATTTFTMMRLHPGSFPEVFPVALNQLHYMLVEGVNDKVIQEQMYCEMPSPWYVKQLIKILGFKTTWTEEESKMLDSVAEALLRRIGEKVSLSIARTYFIVFSEIIMLFSKKRVTKDIADKVVSMLVRYLGTDNNETKLLHYFALDSLHKFLLANQSIIMSVQEVRTALYTTLSSQDSQISSLSFRLLFIIGRGSRCGKEIVNKLVAFLPHSSWEVKPGLCATTIQLAESLNDWKFCVETVIKVLFEAGDYCPDALWTTTGRQVATDMSLHEDAVAKTLKYVTMTVCPPQQLVKFMLYICGECCHRPETIKLVLQFITSRIAFQPPSVQAMMVTTVMKIFSRHIHDLFFSKIGPALEFFAAQANSQDIEVSERAKQYYCMLSEMPTKAGKVMECVPRSFDSSTFDELWDELINNEECQGVSQFDCQPSENESIECAEDLVNAFLCVDTGPIYQDPSMSLYISLRLEFGSGQVQSVFQFENQGILPLTDVVVQIEVPPEMRVQVEPHETTIDAHKWIAINALFYIDNIPSCFPVMTVCFHCHSTERQIQVQVPIHVVRMITSVKVSSQVFIEKWMSIANSQLETKFSISINTSQPRETADQLVRTLLGLEPWDAERPRNSMLAYGRFTCVSGHIDILVMLSYAQKGILDVVMRSSSQHGLQIFAEKLKFANTSAFMEQKRSDIAPFELPTEEPPAIVPVILPVAEPTLPPPRLTVPAQSPPVTSQSAYNTYDDYEEELSSDVGDYYVN